MGTLRTMDESGDIRRQWDPDNAEEVKDAKESFNKFKDKGYSAFKVKKGGGKNER